MIWWHRQVLRHTQDWRRVSPPGWDPGAKGYLVRCSCKKTWAK